MSAISQVLRYMYALNNGIHSQVYPCQDCGIQNSSPILIESHNFFTNPFGTHSFPATAVRKGVLYVCSLLTVFIRRWPLSRLPPASWLYSLCLAAFSAFFSSPSHNILSTLTEPPFSLTHKPTLLCSFSVVSSLHRILT